VGNRAEAIAKASIVAVTGTFQRHTSKRVSAVSGSDSGGRWGPARAFDVLYLGRPLESVVIEAYRHLVDSVEGITAHGIAARKLWTLEIHATDILDVRDPDSHSVLKLPEDELFGPVGRYARCQNIARAAYESGLHGIIAPAAEGLGENLALFTAKLPPAELPRIVSVNEHWLLPRDPRRLHLVRKDLSGTENNRHAHEQS